MLSDHRVLLRQWQDNDLPFLVELRNNTLLQASLMTQPRPNSIDRVRQWLSIKTDKEDCVFFIIADQASDTLVGYLQYSMLSLLHGTAELGICISPEFQGKGYATASLKLAEEYLKSFFLIRKITLKVLVSNNTAILFYERNGFNNCGTYSQHFFQYGSFQDVVLMEKFL